MDKKLILLEYLIEISEFKSSNELAKILNVSTKTISRYVKDLNEIISSYNFEIVSRQGLGYGFNISNDDKNTLKILFRDKIRPNSEFDEEFMNVFKSIISNKSENIAIWSSKLYISESNLRKQLDKIMGYLSLYKLKLKEDINGKYYIYGQTNNRIQAIVNYIHNLPSVESLSQLVTISKAEKEVVKYLLIDYFEGEKIIVSDLDINFLVDLIIVCVNEIRLHRFDESSDDETSKFDLVIKKLRRELGIESLYNYRSIISEWIDRFSILDVKDGFKSLKEDVIDSLSSFDSRIISKLLDNQDLIDQLVVHINKFIKRGQNGIDIENPLIEDIKKGFPVEFSIAYYLCKDISEKYKAKLKESEIGFIAVYLATQRELNIDNKKDVVIICHYGMGTANLLKEKVLKKFPQFRILGIYSYAMRKKAYETDVDLVISSINLMDCPYEYIFVKDIFGDDLTKKIQKKIIEIDDRKDLISLVSPSSFYTIEATTNEDAVIKLGQKLKQHEFLDQKIIDEIMEREKISSTDIGNLVAIPHTFTRQDTESFISICKLKKPIKWGGEFAQLIFLIVFNHNNKNNMGVFRVLYNFIEDKTNVENLLKEFNFLNFVRLMNNLNDGGKK